MSRPGGTPSLESREEQAIDTCTTCPKLCRWACPVAEAEARETSSPWNLVTLSGLQQRAHGPISTLGDLPYHCSQCGACTEACLHKNDVPLVLDLARSRLLSAHAAPAAVVELRSRFGVAGNPYGRSLAAVLEEVAKKAEVPIGRGPGPVYFPGCATLAERPEAAVSFFRALALQGVPPPSIGEISAQCCGLPLLWAGDIDAFAGHAARLAKRLETSTLIVHDAACGHAMLTRYADFGVSLAATVVPLPAFLSQRLLPEAPAENGAEPPARSGSTVYLDGCHLARGLRLVHTPRRLLERAGPIGEVQGLRGASADCCGASGLLPYTAQETAEAMAEARIAAVRAAGASRAVVATPRCAAHLARVDPSIEIVDLTTLLARLS